MESAAHAKPHAPGYGAVACAPFHQNTLRYGVRPTAVWHDMVWYMAGGAVLAAILLDRLGDPPNRFHPTAWMGTLIAVLVPRRQTKRWGVAVVVSCCGLAAASALALWWAAPAAWPGGVGLAIYWAASVPLLKSTISVRGMERHAMAVYSSIMDGDGRAAGRLACIVKRSTAGMDTVQICSGAIESTAENTVDGITGPLFYAGAAGLPGALIYRTVNTTDSMAGYRSAMFKRVGWFGARCDTILNWIPARATGHMMVLAAAMTGHDWRGAYHTMRRDAGLPESANSGYTMAAMAGALGVRLEKPSHYTLGDGRDPGPEDIPAAVRIMKCTAWLFAGAAASMAAAVSVVAGVVYGGLL